MGCGGSKGTAAGTDAEPRNQAKGKTSNPQSRDSNGSTPSSQVSTKLSTGKPAFAKDAKEMDVLSKYRMLMSKEDIMGEGTSSICRRGYEVATGRKVAIKVYKEPKSSSTSHASSKNKAVTLQKFKRQIQVLKMLQDPFKKPKEENLWCKELESEIEPKEIFMVLIDHSVDRNGEPGPDVSSGTMYVVTELAQYSLKDWIATNREKGKKLDKDTLRNLCKAIILAMAGLHAKGFVHIDMKPENLMMFDGKLKVIDVDGCVKKGSKINISDSSISFSPCYCSPEWARFLISETTDYIFADPYLDCWSVGMTLAELVTCDAILKPNYAQFLRNAHSHREASFLFMEWLGSSTTSTKIILPSQISAFDSELYELIKDWLLIPHTSRKSMAECLSHKFLKSGTWKLDGDRKSWNQVAGSLVERHRPEDESTATPLHKGILWKLNSNGNPTQADHWIRRDMWIAQNHSLCYYSVKEDRRLVLIDAGKLTRSQCDKEDDSSTARSFAFTIKCDEESGGKSEKYMLAAESKQELDAWMKVLQNARRMDMIVTYRLGEGIAEGLRVFVKNRRKKVEEESEAWQPVFKAKLWKLKGDGDRTKPDDWFERDMWITKNGSLVYYSPKEQTDLVYYTSADVGRSHLVKLKEGEACRSFVFQMVMPSVNGVEFAPGEFAAESEELRKQWMEQLGHFTVA
mmetsp:Transcript_50678/g.151619  ORF Transcript_50678/g.151619 Transcript_50678/m.151619 type:complete len:686 (-) Transcript_50678:131-2188(-)